MHTQTHKLLMEALGAVAPFGERLLHGGSDADILAALHSLAAVARIAERELAHDLAQQEVQRLATSEALMRMGAATGPH